MPAKSINHGSNVQNDNCQNKSAQMILLYNEKNVDHFQSLGRCYL